MITLIFSLYQILHKSKLSLEIKQKTMDKNIEQLQIKKQKITKIGYPIPDLLLSYVYFLNEYKTCAIIIGYDTEMFTPKVVLLKGKKYQALSWDDWHNFYNRIGFIHQYFEEIEIQKNENNSQIAMNEITSRVKVTIQNCEKYIIFSEESSKIKINYDEWEKLWALAPLIQSIISWYMLTHKEIAAYYNLYLDKCTLQNSTKLDYKDFFSPIQEKNNYCNYSRLFSEIPILCKNKLVNDLYYNLCNKLTQENKTV